MFLYLLQIFNFHSLYTFIVVSNQLSFSSFHFLHTYPTWYALCINATAWSNVSHFSPPTLAPLIHSHSIDISSILFFLIPWIQRKNTPPNMCTYLRKLHGSTNHNTIFLLSPTALFFSRLLIFSVALAWKFGLKFHYFQISLELYSTQCIQSC